MEFGDNGVSGEDGVDLLLRFLLFRNIVARRAEYGRDERWWEFDLPERESLYGRIEHRELLHSVIRCR